MSIKFKPRPYQHKAAETAMMHKSSIVVLPTGMGKTNIAVEVVDMMIKRTSGTYRKILFLTTTRPLVKQHFDTLNSNLVINDVFDNIAQIDGSKVPEKRQPLWEDDNNLVIVSTPQCANNDIGEYFEPEDVALCIFDEAHRAVGDYSYTSLYKKIRAVNPDCKILGLTASPPKRWDEIIELMDAEIIEVDDHEVKPFQHNVQKYVVKVEHSPEIVKHLNTLNAIEQEIVKELQETGLVNNKPKFQDISKARQVALFKIQSNNVQDKTPYYTAMSQIAAWMKVRHLTKVIGTQNYKSAHAFLKKIVYGSDKSKAAQILGRSFAIQRMEQDLHNILKEGKEHPKLTHLLEQVSSDDSQVIIFAELKDTINTIVSYLKHYGIKCDKVTGQSKGYSQKKQLETLERFRQKKFQVLVGTSVIEEGLDIASVNKLYFWEPLPEAVRITQRTGRTGRHNTGEICILAAKKSIDEIFLWKNLKSR